MKPRLLLTFAAIALMLAVLGGVNLYSQSEITGSYRHAVRHDVVALHRLEEIRTTATRLCMEATGITMFGVLQQTGWGDSGVGAEMDAEREEFRAAKSEIDRLLTDLRENVDDPALRQALRALVDPLQDYERALTYMVDLSLSGAALDAVLTAKWVQEKKEDAYLTLLNRVIEAQQAHLAKALSESEDVARHAMVTSLLALAVTLAGVISLGRLVSLTADRLSRTTISRDRYNAVVESLGEAMLITDAAGRLKYANPAACRLAGVEANELAGRPLTSLLTGSALGPDPVVDLMRRLPAAPAERGFRTVEGRIVPVALSVSAIDDSRGRHFVWLATDLTLHKEAQRIAAEGRAAAEEASRAKSMFLARMSHEIRTPMNGIIGPLALMAEGEMPAERRELVAMATDSAQRLLRLIGDILDFSKIEADGMDVAAETFVLREAIERTVRPVRVTAEEKGLRLGVIVAGDTPERVVGDAYRITQVLLNLVSNAVKFTDVGGVSVRVHALESTDAGSTLRFEVRDTGIGIAEAAKTKLFRSFSQADESITRRYGGTGLGLAISALLVEAMGGAIGVDSAEGEGSLFWFTVPVGIADAAPPGEGEGGGETGAPRPVADAPAPERHLEVLLVDDDPVNQLVMTRMIERCGHRATVAGDGHAAVRLVRARPFDVVLMDCHMPGMDGLQATREIRQLEGRVRHTRIVAATASATKGDREACMTAGMDDYITKPVSLESLQAAFARARGATEGAVAPGGDAAANA